MSRSMAIGGVPGGSAEATVAAARPRTPAGPVGGSCAALARTALRRDIRAVQVHVFAGSSGRTSVTRRDTDPIRTVEVFTAPAAFISADVPHSGRPPTT